MYILADTGFLLPLIGIEKLVAMEEYLQEFFLSHRVDRACYFFYEQLSSEILVSLRDYHDTIQFSNSLIEQESFSSVDDAIINLLFLRKNSWKSIKKTVAEHTALSFPDYFEISNEIVWAVDEELRVQYVNRMAKTILGRPPQYYLHKSASELLPSSSFALMKTMAKAAAQTGKKGVLQQYANNRFYSRIPTENGQMIDMEHTIHPLWWKDELAGFVGASRAGSPLEDILTLPSHSFLAELLPFLDHLPVGIIITDGDGTIRYINQFFSDLIDTTSSEELSSFPDLPCWSGVKNAPPFIHKSGEAEEPSGLLEGTECSLRTQNSTVIEVSVYRMANRSNNDSRFYLYFILPKLLSSTPHLISWIEKEEKDRQTSGEAIDVLTQVIGLTKRERQVADLTVEGFQNKEIADRLCIAEITVKKHLTHIFDKCNVHSRVELASLITQHEKAGQ